MLSIFLNRSKSISLKTVFYVNELILKQPQALCIGLIKNLKPLVSTVCNDDEFHSSRYPNLFRDAKASENLNYIVDVKRRFGFIFSLFLTVERIKTKDILKQTAQFLNRTFSREKQQPQEQRTVLHATEDSATGIRVETAIISLNAHSYSLLNRRLFPFRSRQKNVTLPKRIQFISQTTHRIH